VNSKTRRGFWDKFATLPHEVQITARDKFNLWRHDPFHPSLQFKQIHVDLWSVRITRDYRALGLRDGDTIVWFWIGTHADYDGLIGR
jgi:hypothetical protein